MIPALLAPPTMLGVLTPAERLVAVQLAEGWSTKEISVVLARAEPTIKHQISSILRKTGAGSRTRFIAAYYRQFLDLPPRVGRARHGEARRASAGTKNVRRNRLCAAVGELSPAAVARQA